MGGTNLDDIFGGASAAEDSISGVTDLVVVNKPTVAKVAEQTSAATLMDRYKTLFFLVDRSGSTSEVLFSSKVEDYEWPENLVEHIKRITRYSIEDAELLASTEEVDLKQKIIELGPAKFNIYQNSNKQDKLGLMKQAVKDLVDRRIEKYPDAKMVLVTFDNETTIEATDKVSIKSALDSLYPRGGTNIYLAVSETLAYAKRFPSSVGLNHIILVTDGEDWGSIKVKELIPQMQELGVVLDYIYITHKDRKTETSSEVAKAFKEICKALNGEYSEVASATEFEKKFLEAGTRLALPPASEAA